MKAYSFEQLYGRFDPFDESWVPGYVEKILIEAGSTEFLNKQVWLIFDGPIDTEWMEYLNSALDNTRKLSVSNGKSVLVPENFRFIFESDNANLCTPASVSRCGTIYIGQEEVGWKAYLTAWFEKINVVEPVKRKRGQLVHQKSSSALSSKTKSRRLIRRQSMQTLQFRLEHHHKSSDISMTSAQKTIWMLFLNGLYNHALPI